MGKINDIMNKYISELYTQDNLSTEKEAEAAMKKMSIKWDSKKPTRDGAVYLLKGKEVATYDDQYDSLTVLSGKRK